MRQIIILAFVLFGIQAWGQEGFHIVGNLGGSLGGKLFLVVNTPQGMAKLGESVMTAGSFEFKGSVKQLTPAYIVTEQQQPIATLMLENRAFTLKAGATGIEIEGGKQQEVWNEFEAISREVMREKMRIEQQVKAAYASQNQMRLQMLRGEFEKYAGEAQKKQNELLKTYCNEPAAACFLASSMGQMECKALQDAYDGLGEGAKASSFGRSIQQRLEHLLRLEPGGIAPDFKSVTLNGDTVSLYAMQAKVKLVDFWASWCGPCRQENPNVRKIYEKYHADGLEIIGVSLDTKKQDWAKAIRDDKLKWPQVSDLVQHSPVAALYAVRGIPCTYLLDADNRVVAKNLRGKELEKKIKEMLGK